MKKILKIKVIIFIIALSIVILQPVTGFLTAKASVLPNPKPDLVVVPKPDNAEIIDFATRTKVNAYDAKLTNMGKMSTSKNYNTAVAALEYAYTAAGIVADNGVYKDEYKARIQYIKDNSVLPAPLNNLEAEIFFATLDYADMTIGYYMDSAGKKVGNGYVKYKEPSERAAQAFHDAIKDTNYWSKPFHNLDGNSYQNMQCISTAGAYAYGDVTYANGVTVRNSLRWQSLAYGFHVVDNDSIVVFTRYSPLVQDNYTFKDGEQTGHTTSNARPLYDIGNGWYNIAYSFPSGSVVESSFPKVSSATLQVLKNKIITLKDGDYDTTQTGISFMPAVVPATVPTSGKSYVDTDIETYVDGNKNLKPNKDGNVEIPTLFPQEVPFPEYDPEINPYVEPDTEIDPENPTPAPKPSANPQPTTNPEPAPDPEPAPNPDPLPSAEPQPSANPNPEPAPDPEPAPNPDPLPSAGPHPSANPEPEPEPDTETDLDVPSAIGKLDLLDRFPFCVPSDLIQGIKLFNATPTTPTWSWNLSVNGTPIQYTWVVSLDKFEKIAQLCRTLLTILFVWGLAKVTRYVIQG